MATYRHRYVDPDAAGTPADGSTWAKAYRSLSTAENAEDNSGNIVSSDEIVVFHCRSSGGTADATATTFTGWTTDATRFIVIVAEAVNTSYGGGSSETTDTGRHHGLWSDTHYRLEAANASALTISEDYVRVDGLQVGKSASSASFQGAIVFSSITATDNDLWVSNCLVRQPGNASYTEPGIYVIDTDAITRIWNCIVYGLGTNAGNSNAAISFGGATGYIYGCTLIGGAYGLRVGSGTVTAKNCYARGSGGGYSNAGTLNLTTCAASDTTGEPAGLDNIAYTTANFVNVTAGSIDLHLAQGSALYDVGTDTSGDSAPLNFTTDIDGDTRTAWSVGADEGVPNTTPLTGSSPSSVWAAAAIALVAGTVALSGTSPSTAWTPAAATFAATTALSGTSPAATWTPAGLNLTVEPLALSGAAPAATWAGVAIELEPGTVALSGPSPGATWQAAAIDLEVAGQTLSGTSPAATWNLPALSLVSEGGPQNLSGTSAAAAWLVPALNLEAGSVALSGTSPSTAWAVPALSLASTTALVGVEPAATWSVPSLALQASAVALSGANPVATWTVASVDLYASSQQDLIGVSPVSVWTVPTLRVVPGPRVLALVGSVGASLVIPGTAAEEHALVGSARMTAEFGGSTG